MRIEKATANQLPRIVELKLAMFQEAGLAYLLADDFLTRVLQDYQAFYASQDAVHFVALERGKVVAMAGGFLKSDLPYRYYKQPCYGFVGDVYTTPAARHKGLATQLSRMVLHWLKSRGVWHVRLLATPAARPMYERLGFRAIDEMALNFDDV
jgi:GNAT superfamily N-acetyltransferase